MKRSKIRRQCIGRLFFTTVLFLFLTACTASEAIQEGIDNSLNYAPIEEAKDAREISKEKLAYKTLTAETKKVYDQMLECILSFDEKTTLSTDSEAVMTRAMEAILADYGGLYWIDGYRYEMYTRGDRIVGITFSPKYTMDEKKKEAKQEQIDAVVEEWLAGISEKDDDYAKSKYVFEKLVEEVDYDKEAPQNQNILSVFLGKKTVCQGYACATSYLLSQMNIPSLIVSGTAQGESHAWNLVRLDGAYYYMDTTWGNSAYLDVDKTKKKHVNYAYLNITGDELLRTHKIDMKLKVPAAKAVKDNYFRREGLFFPTFDEKEIGAVISDAYGRQEEFLSLKFADEKVYKQAKDYLILSGRVADYCPGLEKIGYVEGADVNVLTLGFDK